MNVPANKPKLHIMIDTNVLYYEGRGDQFFSPSVSKVILDPSHSHLNISWAKGGKQRNDPNDNKEFYFLIP